MGGKGGSSPAGSTTTTSSPWAGQSPFLTDVFNKAGATNSSDPLQYYPGQTLNNVQPQTYQSLALQQQRALSGSPVGNATQDFATNLENGNFLSAGNPYFGNMVGQIGQSIAPSIDSHFNMNGRAGSGANNQAFASALSNTAGQLAFQNYGQTLQQMGSQAFNAPALANMDFQNIGALGDVGSQMRGLGQDYINADMQRFYGTQAAPWQTLQNYAGLVGIPTAGGSQTSPYFSNQIGSALGTAGGALGLFNNARTAFGGMGGMGGKSGGLGGAGGSGLSDAAMNSLTSDAFNNIGAGVGSGAGAVPF